MDKTVSVRIVRDDNKEFLIDGTDWRIPSDGLEGFGFILIHHSFFYTTGAYLNLPEDNLCIVFGI